MAASIASSRGPGQCQAIAGSVAQPGRVRQDCVDRIRPTDRENPLPKLHARTRYRARGQVERTPGRRPTLRPGHRRRVPGFARRLRSQRIEKIRYQSYTLELAIVQGGKSSERLADAQLYVLVTDAVCRASLVGSDRNGSRKSATKATRSNSLSCKGASRANAWPTPNSTSWSPTPCAGLRSSAPIATDRENPLPKLHARTRYRARGQVERTPGRRPTLRPGHRRRVPGFARRH